MSIGILFESKEWSSYILKEYIERLGVSCELLNLEEDIEMEQITRHKLVVNRIFASSIFRNHHGSLEKMPNIINELTKRNIPLINKGEAHYFEIDKKYATRFLLENGIPVPRILKEPEYPLIIKPNCGGRTTFTYVVRDEETYKNLELPDLDMVVEEYIEPVKGFVTRVEIIGGKVFSVMKRTVTKGGLSAYHLGSKYSNYSDCDPRILRDCEKAADLMGIYCGSMDVIEGENSYGIIDVNSVSNASEDNIEDFGFDLMMELAKFAVNAHKEINC